MKKYFKLFALTLIGAISFTACNNELEDNNGNISGAEKEIKIVAGINGLSRTESADGSLTTTFVKDDEIGIFVYESDKAVYSNVKYVYNGTSWTSENAIKAKSEVQYKYYAYYPYNAEVTDAAKVSVTVKADQTGGYNKEDFLTAQNTEAAAGAENITLNFNHAFSLVQVGIKETATTDANATVTLENIIPTAEVNVITGAVAAATGEATSVMMKKSATKMEYRAIVPAQTIAANAKLLSIKADGKTFAVSNSADVNYEKGKALQITVNNLNALPEGEAITIGGSITDWNKGTDPGDGEVDRVYTDLIPTKLKDINNADFKNLKKDPTNTEYENEIWFSLNKVNNNTTTYSCEQDATYGNIIKINYVGNGTSWYNNFVGFYNPNKTNIIKPEKIYTLSFKAKADVTEDMKPAIWTCIKMVKDNLFCTIESATEEDFTNKIKNLTFKNFSLTNEWTEYSFNFKFTLLGEKSGSGAVNEKKHTWDELTVYDYFINLAPRDADTNYYITDVNLIEKE